MKVFRIVMAVVAGILAAAVLVVAGYVIYVVAQYSRIADNYELEIKSGEAVKAQVDKDSFKIVTYNIGFGAYSPDFSFFMDSGTMKDGTKVSGSGSKAKDKQTVLDNTNGAIAAVEKADADFVFLQETDVKSTRARGVNQLEMFTEKMTAFSYVYAENFHSAYLAYPLHDFHGKTNAGLVTFSAYKPTSAIRRSFPVDNGFPTKFFDLDRCFSVTRLSLSDDRLGHELVLINAHLSAYDEGGTIRAQQLEMLNGVLKEERDKGNYVVVGGDFNHDIASAYAKAEGKDSMTYFDSEQNIPPWVFQITDGDLTEGYKLVASLNCATCRSTDMPYTAGVNYTVVLDGFIVSDNIRVDKAENIDTGFKYSDHNPATMTFTLL